MFKISRNYDLHWSVFAYKQAPGETLLIAAIAATDAVVPKMPHFTISA